MIEIRFDTYRLSKIATPVLHSIAVIKVMREAGIPMRDGNLIFHGIKKGEMRVFVEADIDDDTLILQWFEEGEDWDYDGRLLKQGSGDGYHWKRFEQKFAKLQLLKIQKTAVPDDEEL